MDASSEMEMNLEDGRFGLNLGLQKANKNAKNATFLYCNRILPTNQSVRISEKQKWMDYFG
jgi:hypothetical protein